MLAVLLLLLREDSYSPVFCFFLQQVFPIVPTTRSSTLFTDFLYRQNTFRNTLRGPEECLGTIQHTEHGFWNQAGQGPNLRPATYSLQPWTHYSISWYLSFVVGSLMIMIVKSRHFGYHGQKQIKSEQGQRKDWLQTYRDFTEILCFGGLLIATRKWDGDPPALSRTAWLRLPGGHPIQPWVHQPRALLQQDLWAGALTLHGKQAVEWEGWWGGTRYVNVWKHPAQCLEPVGCSLNVSPTQRIPIPSFKSRHSTQS